MIIKKFRNEFPDITIATDIITGYPTETDHDYSLTLDFIREIKPDVLNLSKFSKHKNTHAENLKDIPIEIMNKRNQETMRLHRDTALENAPDTDGVFFQVPPTIKHNKEIKNEKE